MPRPAALDHVQLSSQRRHPLANAEQPHVIPARGGHYRPLVEARSVVLDHQADLAIAAQAQPHQAGVGVAHDVADRFLRNAEERDLHGRRQARLSRIGIEFDVDPFGLEAILGIPANGRHQSQIIQHQRAQVRHQQPQAVHRLQRQLARRLQPLLELDQLLGDGALHPLQLDQQAGQRLAGVIVQLTREAASLLLLRGDHLDGKRSQLALVRLDRGRVGGQAVEHRIQRQRQARDLRVLIGAQCGPHCGVAVLHLINRCLQRGKRPQCVSQHSVVEQHAEADARHDEQQHQGKWRLIWQRPSRQRADHRAGDNHHRVRQQQPRHQRQPTDPGSHALLHLPMPAAARPFPLAGSAIASIGALPLLAKNALCAGPETKAGPIAGPRPRVVSATCDVPTSL